nr:MAG TPA: protein of unknown function (DUF4525) [Caudoviricetes sp.]
MTSLSITRHGYFLISEENSKTVSQSLFFLTSCFQISICLLKSHLNELRSDILDLPKR